MVLGQQIDVSELVPVERQRDVKHLVLPIFGHVRGHRGTAVGQKRLKLTPERLLVEAERIGSLAGNTLRSENLNGGGRYDTAARRCPARGEIARELPGHSVGSARLHTLSCFVAPVTSGCAKGWGHDSDLSRNTDPQVMQGWSRRPRPGWDRATPRPTITHFVK